MLQQSRFRILTVGAALAVLLSAAVTIAAMPDGSGSHEGRTRRSHPTATSNMDGTQPAETPAVEETESAAEGRTRRRDPGQTPVPDETPANGTATETTTPDAGAGGEIATCLSAEEQAFLDLINAYRAENGLQPLANSAALNEAAYAHSLDMSEQGYIDHVSPDGTTPVDRMNEAGYDYNTTYAENIAQGYASAQAVFEGWQNSPEHNQAMLNPDLSAIGIGFVSDGNYWTTDFGGVVDGEPAC